MECKEPPGYQPMDGSDLVPAEEVPDNQPIDESETQRLAQEPISFIQLSQNA